MSTVIYNPKFLTVNGRKTLNTADIKNFIWSHASWFLKAGEMKKFPDDVGEAMLRQIDFLIEVDKTNHERIKKEVEEKKFKCDKCDFETNTKIAFVNHFATHGKENQIEDMEGIEDAQPVGEYREAKQVQNPEEGIPKGGTKFQPVVDKDGVGWYEPGLERDSVS